jgi:phosphatidate cytidylyltransferase
MLWSRLATALVAIPTLLVLIFMASPLGVVLLITGLGVVALAEYMGMAFAASASERRFGFALGALVLAAAVCSPRPGLLLSGGIAAALIAGLIRVVLWRVDFDDGLRDVALMMLGTLYIGVLLPHFVWMRYLAGGSEWITFVIAVGMASDTAGYFVGRAFGRRKLLPRISPGKTVEGALGNVAAGLVAGAASKLILLPDSGWFEMVALAGGMAVLGQIGDLAVSVMKRTFGTKDSGWIFPGHGGVLDRVDSLLFPLALVYYYVSITS